MKTIGIHSEVPISKWRDDFERGNDCLFYDLNRLRLVLEAVANNQLSKAKSPGEKVHALQENMRSRHRNHRRKGVAVLY